MLEQNDVPKETIKNENKKNTSLSKIEVNKQIQQKFCKIITPYGEGTGYIVDDKNGLILSSFHLVGGVKTKKFDSLSLADNLNDEDTKNICAVLWQNGYLNNNGLIVKDAFNLKSEGQINLEPKKDINPKKIEEIFKKRPSLKTEILSIFKQQNEKEPFTLQIKKTQESDYYKIIAILSKNGYLDAEIRITSKTFKITSEKEIDLTLKQNFPWDFTVNNSPKNLIVTPNEMQEIFEKRPNLKSAILSIFNKGFYEKDVSLLSETVEIQYDRERMFGTIFFPEGKDKEKIKKNYAYFDIVPIKINSFEDDYCFSDGANLDDTKCIDAGKQIEFLSKDEELPMIGEKIYFGGYPLTQKEYTFSTGMISSITTEGPKKTFVIEAPVAPGNSGSPVFIQRNGEIYLIGIISSEVARISEKMYELRNTNNNQSKNIEPIQYGNIGLYGSLGEITEALLGNLSTGKGKVIELKDISDLYDDKLIEQYGISIEQSLDFFVPKKKYDPEQKIPLFQYISDKKITQLTQKDICDYLCGNADEKTRKMIFSKIYRNDIKGHIKFPEYKLDKDITGENIEDKIKTSDDESKKLLKHLYEYTLLVSQNKLKDNQFQFSDNNIPTYSKKCITHKFFKDHIGGSNKEQNKNIANIKSQERKNVSVSTTIDGKDELSIKNEVENSQKIYEKAEQDGQKLANEKKQYLIGCFFQTTNQYQLYTCKDQSSLQHKKQAFFYGVVKKNNTYFMHHFAGTQEKKSWKKQEISISEKNENLTKKNAYFEFK